MQEVRQGQIDAPPAAEFRNRVLAQSQFLLEGYFKRP